MDPRFKLRIFSTAGNTAHAWMLLTTECEEYLLKSTPITEPSAQNKSQAKRQNLKVDIDPSLCSLWSLFNEMLADTEEANSERLSCGHATETMVEMYLKEHVQPRHTHPLDYWRQKKQVWLPLSSFGMQIPVHSSTESFLCITFCINFIVVNFCEVLYQYRPC